MNKMTNYLEIYVFKEGVEMYHTPKQISETGYTLTLDSEMSYKLSGKPGMVGAVTSRRLLLVVIPEYVKCDTFMFHIDGIDGIIIDKNIPEIHLYCSKDQVKITKLLNISIDNNTIDWKQFVLCKIKQCQRYKINDENMSVVINESVKRYPPIPKKIPTEYSKNQLIDKYTKYYPKFSREQIAEKIIKLVMLYGYYPNDTPEWNFITFLLYNYKKPN